MKLQQFAIAALGVAILAGCNGKKDEGPKLIQKGDAPQLPEPEPVPGYNSYSRCFDTYGDSKVSFRILIEDKSIAVNKYIICTHFALNDYVPYEVIEFSSGGKKGYIVKSSTNNRVSSVETDGSRNLFGSSKTIREFNDELSKRNFLSTINLPDLEIDAESIRESYLLNLYDTLFTCPSGEFRSNIIASIAGQNIVILFPNLSKLDQHGGRTTTGFAIDIHDFSFVRARTSGISNSAFERLISAQNQDNIRAYLAVTGSEDSEDIKRINGRKIVRSCETAIEEAEQNAQLADQLLIERYPNIISIRDMFHYSPLSYELVSRRINADPNNYTQENPELWEEIRESF